MSFSSSELKPSAGCGARDLSDLLSCCFHSFESRKWHACGRTTKTTQTPPFPADAGQVFSQTRWFPSWPDLPSGSGSGLPCVSCGVAAVGAAGRWCPVMGGEAGMRGWPLGDWFARAALTHPASANPFPHVPEGQARWPEPRCPVCRRFPTKLFLHLHFLKVRAASPQNIRLEIVIGCLTVRGKGLVCR